jgi:DHA1 family multidrug resistance protein-like MFS transporter
MWRARTTADRTVAAVSAAVFVQFAGATAMLPLLPLFLRRQHTSVSLVGVVMASYFAAGVLTQYAAGHLADRAGHRRVMIGGLAIYAIASLGFLLSVSAGGYVALRGLQGLGAGALQLGGLALIGLVVPIEQRGRAFSRVFAAQLSGMAIGPLFGAIAGVDHMAWLFVLSSVFAIAAMVPVARGARAPQVTKRHETPAPLHVSRGFIGVVLVGVIGGVCTGVYESCWSLMMTARGAATWQIGLSWTMFALSFAAFSPIAGRLIDRLDRRRLAVMAATLSAVFIAIYPMLPRPWLLIALGTVEAIGVAIAIPAAQSLLSQLVHPDALGRAQGVFTTAESAMIAAGAAASGYLFTIYRWLPFVSAAVLALALTAVLPRLWRDVAGRASDAAAAPTAITVSSPRQLAGPVVDVTANA